MLIYFYHKMIFKTTKVNIINSRILRSQSISPNQYKSKCSNQKNKKIEVVIPTLKCVMIKKIKIIKTSLLH